MGKALESGHRLSQEVPVGYKRTEMGVIPEEWDVTTLGEITTITTGNTPPTHDASNYGDEYLFVSPVDLGGAKYVVKTEKMLSKKGFAISQRFPADSILFVSIGSTIGKCGIAPTELTSNQQINAVLPSSSFLTNYLYYTICSVAPRIKALAGEQAVPIVNKTQFSETIIPLAPFSEQRAIAEALSDVDGLLGALEALIAKKRAVKQAAMQQLLTGKTRLPGFSGKWETKQLGEIVSFFKGSGLSKTDLSLDGRRRCIHYGELFTVYGERITKVLHGTDRQGVFFRSIRNDVLMPTSDVTPNGLATASCILASDIIIGADVLVIRAPESVINGEFLAYAIKVHRDQVMRLVSGTTVFHLYGRDMANFTFSAPSVDEQTAIVAILSDMDAEIAALERCRDKARAIKQGMMQQLLTGRIRLINESRNE